MTERVKKFTKVPVDVPISELSPLNINCGSTKCEDGLHCFRMTPRQIKKIGKSGLCKNCGIDMVEWARIYKRNALDAPFIFQSLKNELIRKIYWEIQIPEKDILKAHKLGVKQLSENIIHRMSTQIGVEKPYRNGFTPYAGNVIYYAQHATATCCRRCMQYWYDIPMGRALTRKEILFTKDLMLLYLKEKAPEIFFKKPQFQLF